MTKEILEKANCLFKEINRTKDEYENCKVMLENNHHGLTVQSSMSFALPEELNCIMLKLSLDALERKLAQLQQDFDEL